MSRVWSTLSSVWRGCGSAAIFGSVSAVFLAWVFYQNYSSDLSLHLWLLSAHLEAGQFPVPPLYYAAVHALDLLLPYGPHVAVILLLSAAGAWKFNLLRSPLAKALPGHERAAAWAVWCMLIAAPVVVRDLGSNWYLGTLSTAVLTNSTTLFALPFSVLLHFLSLRFLREGRWATVGWMLVTGTIILLIKPSYLFVQVPALPLLCLWERRALDRQVMKASAYALGMGLLLAGLYALVYSESALDRIWYGGVRSQIVMAPLRVWLLWTKAPLLKAIPSLLFVIAFALHDPKAWQRSQPLRYATLVFAMALLIFVLLAETGPRESHGNFYWQVPITLLLLHFTMVHDLAVKEWPPLRGRFGGLTMTDKLLVLAAAAHVVCGVAYIARFILTGIYV